MKPSIYILTFSLLTAMILVIVACGGDQSSANIEATVEAQVQATLAASGEADVPAGGSPPPSSPTATSTPSPTPTVEPIGEEDIAYFRGMLIGPSATEMMELTPPGELTQLHLDLAQAKIDLESANSLMVSAAFSGDMSQFNRAKLLAETASDAYDVTMKRARLAWEEYLSRYGLKLPEAGYLDIAFTSPDDGWIVGSQGTILHYDGQQWQPFDSPTEEKLIQLHMIDRDEGWIVGAEGVLLHYTGGSWQTVENPSSQPYIAKLSVLGSDDVWMLASDLADENPTIEILRYDGDSWIQVTSRTGQGSIADFQMVDAQTGWVEYSDGQNVLLFVNGAWKEASFPFYYDFHSIKAVQLLDATSGWAVGNAGYIFSFNGTEWIEVDSPTDEFLNDLWMIDPDSGWAVGNEGIMLRYDGSKWSKVTNSASSSLWSIKMYGEDVGWIRGGDHTLLRYDGAKWQNEKLPVTQGFYGEPAVLAPNDVWAITLLNGILHFDGSSWEVVHLWPDVVEQSE